MILPINGWSRSPGHKYDQKTGIPPTRRRTMAILIRKVKGERVYLPWLRKGIVQMSLISDVNKYSVFENGNYHIN